VGFLLKLDDLHRMKGNALKLSHKDLCFYGKHHLIEDSSKKITLKLFYFSVVDDLSLS